MIITQFKRLSFLNPLWQLFKLGCQTRKVWGLGSEAFVIDSYSLGTNTGYLIFWCLWDRLPTPKEAPIDLGCLKEN